VSFCTFVAALALASDDTPDSGDRWRARYDERDEGDDSFW
jgi:hypothetical protein